jgi:hypothetical protein
MLEERIIPPHPDPLPRWGEGDQGSDRPEARPVTEADGNEETREGAHASSRYSYLADICPYSSTLTLWYPFVSKQELKLS